MVEQPNSDFQIFVRVCASDFDLSDNTGCRTLVLNINNDYYIADIVDELRHKTGTPVPSNLIKFSYGTKILCHDKSINFYCIGSGTTLHATIRSLPFASNTERILATTEKLTKQIHTIDTKIKSSENEYQDNIAEANSISDLNAKWNGLKNLLTEQNKKYNHEKIKCLDAINSNNTQLFDDIQNHIYINKNELQTINNSITDLNDKIKHHQVFIASLQKDKDAKNEKKILKQKQLETKQKSISDLKEEYAAIRNKINAIEQDLYVDKTSILFESVRKKLKEYEDKYKDWSIKDVVQWVTLIENGKFHNHRLLIEAIKNFEITGHSLIDLRNETCLKLIGLDSMERTIILKNIDRVMNKISAENDANICTVCAVRKINTIFIPCYHQSCCFECYKKHRRKFKKCPICRQKISKTHKTFMAGF